MFWGLIMEPGRCYTQKVKVSFHVSMAALDISNSSEDPAQVMCVFEGRNYLLCTLNKKDKVQCPLDLNFEAGSKVSFATNGKAHVHLTGYLTDMDGDDIIEEEEAEDEETPQTEKKRPKRGANEGPPSKKSKTLKNNSAQDDVEDEESSDSDFDVDKLLEGDDEEAEEEGEEEEAEEGEEDDDDEDEDEDEEASSLSAEESEEEKPVKPKQNGIAKVNATPQKKKNKEQKVPEKVPKEKPKKQEGAKPKKFVLKGGVLAEDLKEGSGEIVKEGKFVHVYYEGRLKSNNKMFDSTTKGPGFSFRLGKGEVIKGWDIGLVGMKVGGKRRLTCPPKVAYGSDGSPPVIPPNATLVFDVEVKKMS